MCIVQRCSLGGNLVFIESLLDVGLFNALQYGGFGRESCFPMFARQMHRVFMLC